MTELYKLNVGDIVEFTKSGLEDAVQIQQDEIDELIDDETVTYQFINLGKIELGSENQFILFPVENDWYSPFYYSYHTEANHIGRAPTDTIIECFKTRLLHALTCYIEYPDDSSLETEIDICKSAVKTLSTIKSLDDI